MKTAIAFVCGCLLLAGCARHDLNKVSVFQYEPADNEAEIALKTAGNFVPWVGIAAVGLAFGGLVIAVIAIGETGASGGIDHNGVHFN